VFNPFKFHWKIHIWLRDHTLKVLAIKDTPEAIAGGLAIGIFFGFTPLFGIKTLSAIGLAWLTGSNILAAVLGGTLHDLLLPFMPVIYYWEYAVGHYLLSHPHHWPARFHRHGIAPHAWRSWTTFITVGRPMLIGSIVCGAPVAVACYFISRAIILAHHRRKAHQIENDPPSPPT
jgi:uncharacterized protein (DUF2062 family)